MTWQATNEASDRVSPDHLLVCPGCQEVQACDHVFCEECGDRLLLGRVAELRERALGSALLERNRDV